MSLQLMTIVCNFIFSSKFIFFPFLLAYLKFYKYLIILTILIQSKSLQLYNLLLNLSNNSLK